MTIELTPEQAAAAAAGEPVVAVDPRTGRAYRLVTEEEWRKAVGAYDDSLWTAAETGLLAGEAFRKLDDTDYRDYLGDAP
jgi:predicted membrane metal-binding protein